jgi:hypothetical protein
MGFSLVTKASRGPLRRDCTPPATGKLEEGVQRVTQVWLAASVATPKARSSPEPTKYVHQTSLATGLAGLNETVTRAQPTGRSPGDSRGQFDAENK